MLNRLRRANPNLSFIRPTDESFARYGRFFGREAWNDLVRRAADTVDPAAEPIYIASIPALEELGIPGSVMEEVFNGEDVQVGICRGPNDRMNGMEWHDCPEINVAVTPMVLLLGHVDQIVDGTWDSRQAVACYLEVGEAVSLDTGTLHFAPCRAGRDRFLSIVILPRGVNTQLEGPSDGDRFLRQTRKWLMAHEDSPQAAQGVPVGIRGPNIVVSF